MDSQRLAYIGQILRHAREGLRYSYRELANLSGVSASQILRMESGEFDYSLTKFIRLAESLGLSVAMVLETTMFRRVPRRELSEFDETPINDFVRTQGFEKESEVIDKGLAIRALVMSLAEIVSALVLSSCPAKMSFHIQHPFGAIHPKIEAFGDRCINLAFHNYERASLLKTLFETPYQKLRSLGILDDQILIEFLQWNQKNKRALYSSLPEITWAASHLSRHKTPIANLRKKRS